MNRRLRPVILFVVDRRSLILAFAVFNFVHVWRLASNSCCCGVVNPWFCSWSYTNEPTLLIIAAVSLRLNRVWANGVSCVLSGYLLGYFVWLFVTYGDGIRVAISQTPTVFRKLGQPISFRVHHPLLFRLLRSEGYTSPGHVTSSGG